MIERTLGIFGEQIGVGVVLVVNALLTAYYGELALYNLNPKEPISDEIPLVDTLFQVLSAVTPFLALGTALCLLLFLVRQRPALFRAAQTLQRAVFWALLLRVIALVMISFCHSQRIGERHLPLHHWLFAPRSRLHRPRLSPLSFTHDHTIGRSHLREAIARFRQIETPKVVFWTERR